jgi:hypothetical protein
VARRVARRHPLYGLGPVLFLVVVLLVIATVAGAVAPVLELDFLRRDLPAPLRLWSAAPVGLAVLGYAAASSALFKSRAFPSLFGLFCVAFLGYGVATIELVGWPPPLDDALAPFLLAAAACLPFLPNVLFARRVRVSYRRVFDTDDFDTVRLPIGDYPIRLRSIRPHEVPGIMPPPLAQERATPGIAAPRTPEILRHEASLVPQTAWETSPAPSAPEPVPVMFLRSESAPEPVEEPIVEHGSVPPPRDDPDLVDIPHPSEAGERSEIQDLHNDPEEEPDVQAEDEAEPEALASVEPVAMVADVGAEDLRIEIAEGIEPVAVGSEDHLGADEIGGAQNVPVIDSNETVETVIDPDENSVERADTPSAATSDTIIAADEPDDVDPDPRAGSVSSSESIGSAAESFDMAVPAPRISEAEHAENIARLRHLVRSMLPTKGGDAAGARSKAETGTIPAAPELPRIAAVPELAPASLAVPSPAAAPLPGSLPYTPPMPVPAAPDPNKAPAAPNAPQPVPPHATLPPDLPSPGPSSIAPAATEVATGKELPEHDRLPPSLLDQHEAGPAIALPRPERSEGGYQRRLQMMKVLVEGGLLDPEQVAPGPRDPRRS